MTQISRKFVEKFNIVICLKFGFHKNIIEHKVQSIIFDKTTRKTYIIHDYVQKKNKIILDFALITFMRL